MTLCSAAVSAVVLCSVTATYVCNVDQEAEQVADACVRRDAQAAHGFANL